MNNVVPTNSIQMKNQSVRVTKFLIAETGTYNNQFRRPFETNLNDHSVIDMLHERIDPNNPIRGAALAGIANEFIIPSAAPEMDQYGRNIVIPINGGWGEPRFRFMMEVETTNQLGGKLVELMLGYSGYKEQSLQSGALDPDMEFYVNSVLTIRHTYAQTAMGTQTYSNITDSSHIIANNNFLGIGSGENDFRMRPVDVYQTMGRTQLTDYSNQSLVDARTLVTAQPLKSSRMNGLATEYSAKLMECYRSASVVAQYGQDSDKSLEVARGYAAEAPVAQDPFLVAISQVRGTSSTNLFTLRDLKRLDQYCDSYEVMKVMLHNDVARAKAHHVGQTENWDGSTPETQVAAQVVQSLPALMMKYGLTGVAFNANNYAYGGMMDLKYGNARSFSEMDLTGPLNALRSDLENILFREIASHQRVFDIEVISDLLGDTYVTLSLNGGIRTPYCVPSFCDALFSPVVTRSDDRALTLAGDFEQIFREVLAPVGGDYTAAQPANPGFNNYGNL